MHRFSKSYSNIAASTPLTAAAAAPFPPASYLQVPAGATVVAMSRDWRGVDTTLTLSPLSDQVYPGHWVSLESSSPVPAVVVVVWEVE
jgi:hypothetical protein